MIPFMRLEQMITGCINYKRRWIKWNDGYSWLWLKEVQESAKRMIEIQRFNPLVADIADVTRE